MDSSDLKWFALLAALGLGLYVALLRGDSRPDPALNVSNAPAGFHTPVGGAGGR